jgi:hypothetical protein
MVAEMLQVMAFDYVVCLMESPGTIAEVHDFAKERQFAVKMMICIDHAHENGYSSNGALQVFEGLHGKLHWFQSPQDLTQCNLATAVMGQVDKVAAAKQYEFARPGG